MEIFYSVLSTTQCSVLTAESFRIKANHDLLADPTFSHACNELTLAASQLLLY